MANSKTQNFPSLVVDEINSIKKTKSEMTSIKNSMIKSILQASDESFVRNGGCVRCQGRESVVVWDTMDSVSGCYAEFGPCPECTPISRSVGFNRAVYGKYDRVRGIEDLRHTLYGNMFESIDEKIHMLDLKVAQMERNNKIEKGMIVCVTRGRKVPVGFVGKIFYIKSKNGPYGFTTTLGIKNTQEVVHWVDIKNVDLLLDQNFFDTQTECQKE
jgi:hypothetical protein